MALSTMLLACFSLRRASSVGVGASCGVDRSSSPYSDAIADQICELIAVGGMLKDICAQGGMPDRVTVWRWRQERPEFNKRFVSACEAKA